jgi:DNA-binding NtrC family response regulator/tetratricopeptide (TPR) repeat protein
MAGTIASSEKLRGLRAQLESAASPAERAKSALQLAECLWLGKPGEATPLLEQAVVDAEKAGDTRVGARAASMLSELLRRAGDIEGSARYAEMVLRTADACGDLRIKVGGLNLVGMVQQERGHHRDASECFEECLRLSRQTGYREGEQSALNQLASVYGLQGETEKALECYRKCLEASTEAGDAYGRAIDLHNIGWTLASMGRWAEATEHFHRTIALCEDHGYHDLLLSSRMQLGELASKRSDFENAALMFGAVIKAEREAKHSGRLLREALSDLGWTQFQGGDLARASQTLDESARLSEAAEDRCMLATIDRRRAELAFAQGQLDAADGFVARAERYASELDLRKEQGEVLRVHAVLATARGDMKSALDLLSRSQSTLESLGDTRELGQTLLERGRLLLDAGRPRQAAPLLEAATRTFRRLAIVAEAEEARRLLSTLGKRSDRKGALLQVLLDIASLGLGPERFVEQALGALCDNLRFDQGAAIVGDRPVALKGNPDLDGLPEHHSSFLQSDWTLLVPVRQNRRVIGFVWLCRAQRRESRVGPEMLELVARTLAQPFAKLGELKAVEPANAPQIPGLRFRGVVGSNPEVLAVLRDVPNVAGTAVPVLVRGESGTGKELIARALHESSPRADRPFVTVNCAAVPENLLEAEFFGVETGAATGVVERPGKFELAAGGTVFLDEVGDMSPLLQARLLRVVEDKTVMRVGGTKEVPIDARVIAATNMDLDVRERQGLFRRDLLYRLNTIQFVIPPLSQRADDIPALTEYFITRTAQEYGRAVRRASNEVLALFASFPWPGNIRQLRHAIERGVILATGDTLQLADLPPEFRQSQPAAVARPIAVTREERLRAAAEAEEAMLHEALRRTKGNVTSAAKLTGYSRAQFHRLLQKYNITDSH